MCFFKKRNKTAEPTKVNNVTVPEQSNNTSQASQVNPSRVSAFNADAGREKFVFEALPKNLEELKSMKESALDSPFSTAALTLCALCVYGKDKENGKEMLNFLRGPRPLSNMDISFLNDRFMDGKDYVPFSYFDGATPSNDYKPSVPYSLTFFKDAYSEVNAGYMKLNIKSNGADNPRQVVLRKIESTGKWHLWEQHLLSGIKQPVSENPWA